METNVKLQRRTDLAGQKFGRLTVLHASERKTPSRGMYWVCQCDCGTFKDVAAQSLTKGTTVSCGCYNKEYLQNNAKHGHNRKNGKKSPTYSSWCKMNDRCNNPNCREYKWYGARGITVCEEWKSFVNFLKDMGERPDGKTIDRIDHNGNYEPSNCRWSGCKAQANNTRRNVLIEHNGETKTVAEWADIYGLKYDTLYYRIFIYGFSLEQAMQNKKYVPIPHKKVSERKNQTNFII